MRRRITAIGVDLGLVGTSTVLAFLVRHDFALGSAHVRALVPYLATTALVAAVLLPLAGLHRSVWRFSGFHDGIRLFLAAAGITAVAVVASFAMTRLEGVPRSVPVIQLLLMVFIMVGARVLLRLRHQWRGRRSFKSAVDALVDDSALDTVLVVGLGPLTELYIRSALEHAVSGVRVVGLLGRTERHTGRVMHGVQVLGTPEQVVEVMRDLAIHGVQVDRIVVTVPFATLDADVREALQQAQLESATRLEFLSERLGFERSSALPHDVRTDSGGSKYGSNASRLHARAASVAAVPSTLDFAGELERAAARPYWQLKRAIDFVTAAVIIALLLPVMAVVAVVVAVDLGLPILFWQQRPGLAGWPFILFKFRTMDAAHDDDGRPIGDEMRVRLLGRLLRRFRLDELPQLFSILTGAMSFVGPRPLLQRDQGADHRARLLVRPGLTGWAQVSGGREISMTDKMALDVWYIQNASLALDIRIVLRTVGLVLFGERRDDRAIDVARDSLPRAVRHHMTA